MSPRGRPQKQHLSRVCRKSLHRWEQHRVTPAGVPSSDSVKSKDALQETEPSHGASKQVVDLTVDGDGDIQPIKYEPDQEPDSKAEIKRQVDLIEDSEEDVDDLEDELKEVQLRRKLRALKKRKMLVTKTER